MHDRDALLRAVLDCPADDKVRVVFADWFEEHGHYLNRLRWLALGKHPEAVRDDVLATLRRRFGAGVVIP
jgi:uncharacterized protein (TIGR02996 family)